MKPLLRRLRNRNGQALVEYVIILSFISLLAVTVMLSLRARTKMTYDQLNTRLASAQASH